MANDLALRERYARAYWLTNAARSGGGPARGRGDRLSTLVRVHLRLLSDSRCIRVRPSCVAAARSLLDLCASAAVLDLGYAQDAWALKTKYILFLLPVYALLATGGLDRLLQLPGRAGAVAAAAVLMGFGGLFTCASCYIAVFAFA